MKTEKNFMLRHAMRCKVSLGYVWRSGVMLCKGLPVWG
jgi:hypothetical protein